MSRTIGHEELRSFCEDVLEAAGLSSEHASVVGGSLVEANLRGVDSHGVMRLPIYVQRMEMGLVNVRPELRVERTADATATLDADDGPGQVATLEAMRVAVDLARRAGAGVVSIRNSTHFGAAAFFAMEACRADMIGIALTHAGADVVPYGGRLARLGTNPIGIALPTEEWPPLVLDMATSIVALGKVFVAAAEGRDIPPDWAVDEHGNPCTDPNRVRAVRPMAGPKGSGLALVIDALCALLAGAAFGVHIRRMYEDFSEPQRISHLVLALDPARFVPVGEFKKRMVELAREVKDTPPEDGFDEVRTPGEVEARTESIRR
ncbi:MAG: Ldh family oxidoreductase, partial [Actinomycetota bacterium]